LKQGIKKILEIVCNPYTEGNRFKEEYVNQEKENIRRRIESKIDNKGRYAIDRCVEEMYKDKPYGLYKYGYVEDLDGINEENLYEHYKTLINECKIDIFVSGEINEEIDNLVKENENIKNLNERDAIYNVNKLDKKEVVEENIVQESLNVTQGKLVLGLDINIQDEKEKYYALMYNSILGGTANSKLFQEVREKASLAYTASSSYLRYKNNIIINCGIEIQNYEKALEIIRKQLEDMKNGEFSDEDVENSKKIIISTIKSIDDEQDTEITYFLGQELTENKVSLDEYIKIIENISKEDVLRIADKVNINTIYFLKD